MRIDASTRAFITGGSPGVRRALREALAARGATVGIASRTGDEALARALSPKAIALECDVGDRESVERATAAFIERAGGLDLVVANAGIAHYGPFLRQDLADIEAMTRVNWLGTVYTVHAALGHLIDRAQGHVVIVSSGAGLRSFPWAAGYGATKAAQRMFASALRRGGGGPGVGATPVSPGETEPAPPAPGRAQLPAGGGGGGGGAPPGLAPGVPAAVEADRR